MKALRYNPSGIDTAGIVKIKCPAGHTHYINTKEKNSSGAIWTFNGNYEKPTFTPSINEKTGKYASGCELSGTEEWLEELEKSSYICHFIVTDGKITFCGDCTHSFKGQTLDLLDI